LLVKLIHFLKNWGLKFLKLETSDLLIKKRLQSSRRKEMGKPSNISELKNAIKGWKDSEIKLKNHLTICNNTLSAQAVANKIFEWTSS
jgi:hypothetical protein